MIVKSISVNMGGHTIIEFESEGNIYRMGTFCLQIPGQITSLEKDKFFEIPDEFMKKELGLVDNQNPVKWYQDQKEELKITHPDKISPLFEKFMDTVAKFCNYDRKRAMEERRVWYEKNFM